MTEHPITPPPELVEQWADEAGKGWRGNGTYEQDIATQAARWGSDQELEACCEWLGDAPVVYNDNGDLHPGAYLRDARRSKMLSLKEQALALLDKAEDPSWDINDFSIVRKALKRLND
jgi:hypothetical protein